MRFSAYAGITIVPTLARLVLALAFVTAGYNKLFRWSEFDAAQATRLLELGADVRRVDDRVGLGGPGQVRPARLVVRQDDAPAAEAADTAAPTPPAAPPSAAPVVAEPPAPARTPPVPARTVEPLPEGRYEALSLYRIALLCDSRGMPQAFWLSWTAAVTEFVGGAFLLLGLLSRVFGLGLGIAMATAVYLTTLDPYLATGPFEAARGADGMRLFNQVFTQLGLGVLALGVALTGPGPLSLDHMLRRRQPRPVDALGYPIDEAPPPPGARPSDDGRDHGDDDDDGHGNRPDIPPAPVRGGAPAGRPGAGVEARKDPVRSHERPI